jgi:hypothetical protein
MIAKTAEDGTLKVEHEHEKSLVRIRKTEDDAAHDRLSEPTQQQHPRPPLAADEAVEKLAEHVRDEIDGPDVRGIAQVPVKLFHQAGLAQAEDLAGEVVAAVAEVGREQDTPAPRFLPGRE